MTSKVTVDKTRNRKLYGYILRDKEYVLLEVRPQFLVPTEMLSVILGLLLLLPVILVSSDPTLGWTLFGLALCLVMLIGIDRWVRTQHFWVLTNQRLFSREGVFKRRRFVIDLNCITHMGSTGGFFSPFLADGKVMIFTAGNSKAAMTIRSQRFQQRVVLSIRAAMTCSNEEQELKIPISPEATSSVSSAAVMGEV